VNELFDGRFMGSVVTRRPERMGLIERSVVEDLFMYGTGRNENESTDTSSPSCFDQY
jgi:hypothetical protein